MLHVAVGTREGPGHPSRAPPSRTDERAPVTEHRRATPVLSGLSVCGVRSTPAAELLQFEPVPGVRFVLRRHVVAALALLARQRDRRSLVTCHCRFASVSRLTSHVSRRCSCGVGRETCGQAALQGGRYLLILTTRPAPTVRPPSRIANRNPSSIAIGLINSTVISVLSPGITICVPSGNVTFPVTSVVRK